MKTKIYLYLLVLLFSFSLSAAAQTENGNGKKQEKSSINMSMDLGVLLMQSTSTLDANGEAEISDNTEEGKAPQSVWAFPLFDLRYTLQETHTQFFFGTPIDGSNIALSLGVIQPVPEVGIFSLSIAPSVGVEAWKNPYRENVKREKTPINMLTTNVKLDHIGFTPLNLEYRHRTVAVKKDEIGRLVPDLERNGTIQSLKTTYAIGLSESSLLLPGVSIETGNFTGESNNYQESGMSLSYKKMNRAFFFIFEATVDHAEFKKKHPLYNQTRKENGFNTFALLRFQQIFGIEAMHSNIVLGGGTINSNIDFFDNETFYTAFTMGYSF